MRSHNLKFIAAAILVMAVTLQSATASAADPGTGQTSGTTTKLDPAITTLGGRAHTNIAGTVGLGLLGAEVGLLLPPLLGLHNRWWAWALFPAVGAAGGAVAGALAFDSNTSNAITVPMLGAGLALAIPALVASLVLKDRRENRDLEQRVQAGGLIRVSRSGARVGVPNVVTAPVYTAMEQQRFGLPQRTSTRIELLSARF